MTKRLFPCRIEELPVICAFILDSARNDLEDFNNFSTVFTTDFLDKIDEKIEICKEVSMAEIITKELKAATEKLTEIYSGLRVPLNKLEGYLNLSEESLDIAVKDFGLKAVRDNITSGNVEGLLKAMSTTLSATKRNRKVLESMGMSQILIDEIEISVSKIDELNLLQNQLMSKRSRLSNENVAVFNELWESVQPILKTAQAIYRGVDPVKLKDYTISHLLKKVNTEGNRSL